MTSHWIAFFQKIIRNLNFKIIRKDTTINLLPDNNSNLNIDIFLKKTHTNFNLFERIKISKSIKKIQVKNSNIYRVKYDYFSVNNNYKTGYRYMYYDFIKSCVLNTKKSSLGSNALDLLEIYKICKMLEN